MEMDPDLASGTSPTFFSENVGNVQPQWVVPAQTAVRCAGQNILQRVLTDRAAVCPRAVHAGRMGPEAAGQG